jgi:hypothetical protein
MIEFLRGYLPWRREKEKALILPSKEKHTNEAMTHGLPRATLTFFQYLTQLEYADKPDYDYLQDVLDDLFYASGETHTIDYDWELRIDVDDTGAASESMNVGTSVLTGVRVASRKEELFTDLVEVNKELERDVPHKEQVSAYSAQDRKLHEPDSLQPGGTTPEELPDQEEEILDDFNAPLQDISNLSGVLVDSNKPFLGYKAVATMLESFHLFD